MNSAHNAAVAGRFARSAARYDRHAGLQADVADSLAQLLPKRAPASILELGCGTGLFSRHLCTAYPGSEILVTDIAGEMVEQCRRRLASQSPSLRFAVMDGERLEDGRSFDLIALSMTLQWFADPLRGLKRLRKHLKPGGQLIYATIGPDGFPEWRAVLEREGLRDGLIEMPALPGVEREQFPVIGHDSPHDFLAKLKGIGATLPRAGYRALGAGALRAALRRLEHDFGSRVTWHIVYGRLAASA